MPKARFVSRPWSVVSRRDKGQRTTHDEQISLPHDRGLSRRGKDDGGSQTRRKADEARAARRPDHERPGQRTGGHENAPFARVRYGRNSGRLFLLSVQFARGRSEQADRRHTSRRVHRRAGRQLHRSGGDGHVSAAPDLWRQFFYRAIERAGGPDPRAAHLRIGGRRQVFREGALHLPQATGRSGHRRHQQVRRARRVEAANPPREADRSIPACGAL